MRPTRRDREEEKTMIIAARMRCWMTRIFAMGALLLLLGTVAAAPARAYDRDDAVVAANNYIDHCFADGGEPIVVEDTADSIVVSCLAKDGTWQGCGFWPALNCFLPNDHGTHGGLPTGGSVLDSGGATRPQDGIAAPVNGNGTLATRAETRDHVRSRRAAKDHDRTQDHQAHHRQHRHGKR